eukprot:CAMPEP_0202692348 /NCGR_PEP_ID=MMETSP1385-20130828/6755_1 /ASSEMBLY_ACC=CAM_ASM_000861 /TAXON_ID=933848 /ORGANISM="Elphidium margaritaceum" /LENGTH=346 /DNA_ID=CAMNT_0049347869 /DNA_START=113 /DNA_END=1153 /DNA_ORIENTATION=-
MKKTWVKKNTTTPTPTNADTNEQKKAESSYRFSVASFNVWCPHWNDNEETKKWKRRHRNITKILLSESSPAVDTKKNAASQQQSQSDADEDKQDDNDVDQVSFPAMDCDIFCLQEFWCDRQDFARLYDTYLKSRGFDLHSLKRNAPHKPDGLAMAFNKNVFEMVRKIDYKFTVSNRVMMMMELRHKASQCVITVACTHLTFPSHEYDGPLRAEQIKQCLQVLNERTSQQSALTLLTGDFNCDIGGNESKQCLNDGYLSSYHVCNADSKHNVVSHVNHRQESVFVDHIFYKHTENSTAASGDKEPIFTAAPAESYLYPKSLQSENWNQKWQLSDHRPIVTVFKLARA